MSVRVGMVSLGCPKNQVDAELMLGYLADAGYDLVEDAALADVAIVNTCGFIESAKSEAIEEILELATLKKEGRIKSLIVTGCMAERYRDAVLEELPEVDAVVGIGSNHLIAEIVKRVSDEPTAPGNGFSHVRQTHTHHAALLQLPSDRRRLQQQMRFLRHSHDPGQIPFTSDGGACGRSSQTGFQGSQGTDRDRAGHHGIRFRSLRQT